MGPVSEQSYAKAARNQLLRQGAPEIARDIEGKIIVVLRMKIECSWVDQAYPYLPSGPWLAIGLSRVHTGRKKAGIGT